MAPLSTQGKVQCLIKAYLESQKFLATLVWHLEQRYTRKSLLSNFGYQTSHVSFVGHVNLACVLTSLKWCHYLLWGLNHCPFCKFMHFMDNGWLINHLKDSLDTSMKIILEQSSICFTLNLPSFIKYLGHLDSNHLALWFFFLIYDSTLHSQWH